jgi:hypothetical protein
LTVSHVTKDMTITAKFKFVFPQPQRPVISKRERGL